MPLFEKGGEGGFSRWADSCHETIEVMFILKLPRVIMKEKLTLTEFWLKLILLVFFVLLYLLSTPYPLKAKQFPQLIALFSLIVIVVSLVTDFVRKGALAREITDVGDTELKTVDKEAKGMRRRRFYHAWAIILVSTAAGFLGGFLFTTFFLFISFALFFGEKKNLFKNGLVTVSLTIIVYFTFQWVFGIPLLRGVLW